MDVDSNEHRSSVFRSMLLDLGGTTFLPGREIRLTDDQLERADVLRMLLNIGCGGAAGELEGLKMEIPDGLDLVHLARKYDCTTVLYLLRLAIGQPGNKTKAFARFYWSCALDDRDAAHRFLPFAAAETWSKPKVPPTAKASVFSSLSGMSALDVTAMSATWIDRLPRKYFLALLRASRLRALTDPAASTWEKVADDFREQVKLYGA